jgi:hypothetical protein
VDNGSILNEAEKLSHITTSKNIKFFRIVKNLGFTGGNNWALKKAKGKYIALLNNDTSVEPNWLNALVNELETYKKTAVVQPKIRLMSKPNYFDYAGAAGGLIDKYGYPFTRGRIFNTIEKDTGQYDQRTNIFWASGAACIIRKSVINKVGGLFSENLFNYMEEIDFCWRVLNSGYKVVFVPEAVVYHKVAGTSKTNLFKKRFWEHRNNLFILTRNLDRSKLITIIPMRAILELATYLKYLSRKEFKYIFSLFLAHADYILKFVKTRYRRNRLPNKKYLPIYPRSIVIDYFIRKNKHFTSLNWSPKGNVSYLLYDTKASGGMKLIFMQINGLISLGYNVNAYSFIGHKNNIDWFPLKTSVRSVFQSIFDTRADFVISTFWPTSFFVNLFKGKKKFYFVLDSSDFYSWKLLKMAIKLSFKLPVDKITISEYLVDKIRSSSTKFRIYKIISCPLNRSLFNSTKSVSKMKKDKYNILSVMSYYKYYKGPDLLVKAVKEIKKTHNNINFALVSRERYKLDDVFDRFYSNPSDSKLASIYRNSDALLVTSRAEGLFIPGLEAMASGCPVVTTNSKGLLDYAKNNYNALIVKNLSDLWRSNIITKILKDRNLRNKIIKNGLTTASKYSSDNISKDLENILIRYTKT